MFSTCRFVCNRFGLLLLGLLWTALPALAQNSIPVPSARPQAKASQVSVQGDVKKPGLYPWHPGLRVLELLAACDGPTAAPERTQTTLITRFGKEEVPINLDTLLAGTDPAQNRALLPGDTLIVAPSSTGGEVQMVGQIAHPGLYHVPKEGLPLIAVLNEAGGPLPDASLSRAQIQNDNRLKFKSVDLRPVSGSFVFSAQDVRLLPGDRLLIPERGRVVVSGAVRHGGIFPMPDGQPFTVAEVLALAGGLINDAESDKIVIVRRRYGKPVENIHAGLNDQLMAGDILLVATPFRSDKVRPWLIAGTAQGVAP